MRVEPVAEEIEQIMTHSPIQLCGAKRAFKETELGLLPDDWIVSSITESCDEPEYGYTASAEQEPVGPRFLRITDIQEQGVDWDSVPYYHCDEATKKKHQLHPGDLLFARIGATTGKSFLVRRCPDAVYASYLIRVRAKTVDPAFLYYFCNSELYWRQINASTGDKLKGGVSGSVLAQVRYCLPPLLEQRAIAAVLSKIQAAVEVQDKIIVTLKELKAATMAKLFREGLRGEPLKQTEIGEIPESWEAVRLGEVASIERGKFAHRPRNEPRFYGGMIPFIQTGDVAKCNGRIRTYTQTLNEDGLTISRLFPKGTVVLTIAANIADTGILEFDSAFPDSLVGIAPDRTMDAVFLEYYLRTQKAEMDRLAPKGTQKNINIQFLKPWPTPRPSIDEQREIAHSLRCLDERLEMASAECDTLKSLFSSMLHLLMTGQVRVNNLRIEEVSK